jgi:tRNA(Ile)-lysidine synthase
MPDATDLVTVVLDRVRALAPEAARVAVGVSGGGDSVALACLLVAGGVDIAVLHVDHGLRPTSTTDATFVEGLAATLGVRYSGAHVPVAVVAKRRGWNLEDAARRLRREALHRMARAEGADVIALAHTVDDQAETVLLQALRGAAYLHGMPARRGRIVRPLLGVSRNELRAWLDRERQPWREDPTNEDLERARAWVRHALLPRMDAHAGGATHRLARLATVQRDVAAFVRAEAARRVRGGGLLLGDGAPDPQRRAAAEDGLDAVLLARQPVAVQREALAALMAAAEVPVDHHRIETARGHLETTTPWRASAGAGATLRIAYGRVAVVRAAPPVAERSIADAAHLPDGVPPEVLADGPLVLRGRRPGDLVALPGGHRSLADVLVDARVPREARDGLRLLARGSEVVWVDGVVETTDRGPRLVEDDEHRWMRRALELARGAAAAGELPVGAVVVVDGAVVGEGANATRASGDPTAHAELVALRAAAAALGDWRLANATLVVTLEPCPMCFGAILAAHVGRVVFAAENRRDGALGGVADLTGEGWKRRVEVRGGVRAHEASALLTRFFGARRA